MPTCRALTQEGTDWEIWTRGLAWVSAGAATVSALGSQLCDPKRKGGQSPHLPLSGDCLDSCPSVSQCPNHSRGGRWAKLSKETHQYQNQGWKLQLYICYTSPSPRISILLHCMEHCRNIPSPHSRHTQMRKRDWIRLPNDTQLHSGATWSKKNPVLLLTLSPVLFPLSPILHPKQTNHLEYWSGSIHEALRQLLAFLGPHLSSWTQGSHTGVWMYVFLEEWMPLRPKVCSVGQQQQPASPTHCVWQMQNLRLFPESVPLF